MEVNKRRSRSAPFSCPSFFFGAIRAFKIKLLVTFCAVLGLFAGPALFSGLSCPGYTAERTITLLWDESIDAPYLQSYKVYYYTTPGDIASLNAADYATTYLLVGNSPVAINPLSDPEPITIDRSNTQITLNFPDAGKTYYFVVTAVDTRGLESIPTPEVTSGPAGAIAISIGSSSATATKSGPVTYAVTYTGASAVTLTAIDVTLNKTGTANGTIAVTGTDNTRTVTISAITGDGTLGISIGAGTASDSSGNLAAASGPSATFTVDNTAPVTSIGIPSATTTKSGPVTYPVTYTGASGVTLSAADVTLNKTGTANGTIAVTGTGNARTVTISAITGDGTLGISIGGWTAGDSAGNLAGPSGPSATFAVDNTAPVAGIGIPSATITKSGPVSYTVTYTGASGVTLSAADVTLNKTGTANGTIAVTGTGNARTVTISAITGDGTLAISIGAGTANDIAGNLAGPSGPSAAFAVDNSAPTVSIGSPSVTSTKAGPVTYAVAYTGASTVTLAAVDVTLNKTGTANGTVAVAGTGNARTVTISAITGDGTLGISIGAGTASDSSGNLAGPSGPSAAFAVDNSAPTISVGIPSATTTKSGPVTYAVAYTEASTVTLSAVDVTLNKTGTANGTIAVTGTGNTRTVTISAITGDGTLGISIGAGTASDSSGNLAGPSGPSAAFAVDNSAPTVSIGSPSVTSTKAGPVTYAVAYTEASTVTLAAVDVTLNKTGTANGTIAVTGTGNARTVTISAITGDGTLGISIGAGTASDSSGNLAGPSGPSAAFAVDNTAPVAGIGIPSVTSTKSGPVTYAVTYTGASTVTLAAVDVTLNKTGTANGTIAVTGTGNARTATISAITGDGTLGISIGAGTASDIAGNLAAASGPSATFAVDNTAPTVSIGIPSATTTKAGPVSYTVTYTGASGVTLSAADVVLNKTGTANGTVAVAGTDNASTVTISAITGDGTLGISIGAGTASDIAGNLAAASGPSAAFTVDNTAPTVSIGNPSSTSTKSGPVSYTVTYTGASTVTLTATDVTLNKTGTANGTIAVTGTGNARTVTISAITGDGTLAISIGAGTASDIAGNLAGPSGPSATFTVDNTAPTVSIGSPSVATTKSGPVTYAVIYTGASTVTLSTVGVTLNKTGTANGTIAMTGTGNARTVTISAITGDGTLGISIGAGTASDIAGNLAGASGPSATFTVDNTTPVIVKSIVTQGNIPGLLVVVVDGMGNAVGIYGVASDGSWSSPFLPSGTYDWYLIYGSLISAKNATTFDISQIKSISGRISGLPPSGGVVSVMTNSGRLKKAIAVPADGNYTVTNLVPANDYLVAVVAADLPVTYFDGKTDVTAATYVNILATNAVNIDFTLLTPDSHITGIITDAGNSVAGLTIYGFEVNSYAVVPTKTLADGSYDLKVNPGKYGVCVIKGNGKIFCFYNEDGTPTQKESNVLARTISTKGQTIGNTNINIAEGDRTLEGKVVFQTTSGSPAANVLITASTSTEINQGLTGLDGRYKLSGLRNGVTYLVEMKTLTGGYPVQTGTIVAGQDATKDFILDTGIILSGTVKYQSGNVPGVMVYLKDQATGSLVGGRVYYTGANGAYSIHDLKPGSYIMEAIHPDYGYDGVSLTIGTGNVVQNLALKKGAYFKGVVKDNNGVTLAGATIIVTRPGSGAVYSITSSAGVYNVYGLDATMNDYIVTAQKRGYDQQTKSGQQPAAAGAAVDFTLLRPTAVYQVSGIVMTSDSVAVKDAVVHVSSKSLNFFATTTTDAYGAYTVSGLVNASDYLIVVMPGGNLPIQSQSFAVSSINANINFAFALGKDIGGSLTGSPAFPSNLNVYVFLYKGEQYVGFTKAEGGSFLFKGLAEGADYKIMAVAAGYASQWYNGKSDIAAADLVASGSTNIVMALSAQ